MLEDEIYYRDFDEDVRKARDRYYGMVRRRRWGDRTRVARSTGTMKASGGMTPVASDFIKYRGGPSFHEITVQDVIARVTGPPTRPLYESLFSFPRVGAVSLTDDEMHRCLEELFGPNPKPRQRPRRRGRMPNPDITFLREKVAGYLEEIRRPDLASQVREVRLQDSRPLMAVVERLERDSVLVRCETRPAGPNRVEFHEICHKDCVEEDGCVTVLLFRKYAPTDEERIALAMERLVARLGEDDRDLMALKQLMAKSKEKTG